MDEEQVRERSVEAQEEEEPSVEVRRVRFKESPNAPTKEEYEQHIRNGPLPFRSVAQRMTRTVRGIRSRRMLVQRSRLTTAIYATGEPNEDHMQALSRP